MHALLWTPTDLCDNFSQLGNFCVHGVWRWQFRFEDRYKYWVDTFRWTTLILRIILLGNGSYFHPSSSGRRAKDLTRPIGQFGSELTT